MKASGLKIIFPLALAASICAACPDESKKVGGNTDERPKFAVETAHTKVFVLGIDGLSWTYLNPMIKAGALHNMGKIVNGGSSGILKSVEPIWSPLIWTTMITGVTPEKHGITNFEFKLPGSNKTVPAVSILRKTKALWNILSMKDRRVYIVNWWGTWPAEKVNGFMVSDKFPDDPTLKDVYPKENRSELARTILPRSEKNFKQFIRKYIYNDIDVFYKLAKSQVVNKDFIYEEWLKDAGTMDVTLALMDKGPFPDLFMSYIDGTDKFSHYYFGYGPLWKKLPRWINNKKQSMALGKMMSGYYRFLDNFVGAIMKKLPEDAVLIIVSDHGFKFGDDGVVKADINGLLQKWGYLEYDENGEIDMSKTRVYDLTLNPFFTDPNLYINWKDASGKNPAGTVSPEEGNALLEELKRRFETITSENKKIFHKFETPSDGDGPDLKVYIDKKSIGKTVVIDGESVDTSKFFSVIPWSGRHDIDGVIMIYGPGVKPGFKMADHSTNDICKTILFLQGFPVGKDMVGNVIRDPWVDADLRRATVKIIPSYGAADHSGAGFEHSPVLDKDLQKLRDLGYIK